MADSDDDEFEVHVFYGTPLEELDEDDGRTRKAPRVEDQVVLDKQGRRRFHGAFTGGFSAGYFNSVGTKEGWTPAEFVSTRGQRPAAKQARPQDFMDDEDLAAFGISPQGIQPSANFQESVHKRKRVMDPSGPIPGCPVLEEILQPKRETVGVKLLRRLGWKPGQGVGPRVSRRQKVQARREQARMYSNKGAEAAGESSDSEEEDEGREGGVTFAPDDVTPPFLTNPKTDKFGLGYKPLDRTPVLGGHFTLFDPSPLTLTEKKKKVLIKGQAFGVGAFEEDDEDIYTTEDMSNYDFGEEQQDSKQAHPSSSASKDLSALGLVEALEGFHLSSQQHRPKLYPLPPLPRDFIPCHRPHARRFELRESEVRGLGRHQVTAEDRARMLEGQATATVEVRSGVKGHQPLEKIKEIKTIDTSEVDKIYEEFKNIDSSKSSDFKPFSRDPEKQKRYELFLRMKEKKQKDRFYLAQPKSMTEWQKERERQEFNRAAQLFQPLTSSMANRFVSAVTSETGVLLQDGLNVNVAAKAAEASKQCEVDSLGYNISDERIKAAKMKMFGHLTLTTIEWHPDNILCRRFNVPNPFPDSSFVGAAERKKEKLSIFNMLNAPLADTAGLQASPPPLKQDRQQEHQQEGGREDLQAEDYGLKVPVDGPPTMDLFKAIFQDSDSEDESGNEQEESRACGDPSVTPQQQSAENSSSRQTEGTSLAGSRNSEVKIRGSQKEESRKSERGEIKGPDERRESSSNTSQRHNLQRTRISRFEPSTTTAGTSQADDLPKPVFIPQKKFSAATKPVPPAEGIFANIDFEALNSYRNLDTSGGMDCEGSNGRPKEDSGRGICSDSSDNSEEEYGPAIPSHLRNKAQVIRATPPPTPHALRKLGEQQQGPRTPAIHWVEKSGGKSHKKSKKHHHKRKEEKKKKREKKKKHKEKKMKKKSHKSSSHKESSSDSSTDSSN